MVVVTTTMFDDSTGSGDVFMRASNPTHATWWYSPDALDFTNVLKDPYNSYGPLPGGQHGNDFIVGREISLKASTLRHKCLSFFLIKPSWQ